MQANETFSGETKNGFLPHIGAPLIVLQFNLKWNLFFNKVTQILIRIIIYVRILIQKQLYLLIKFINNGNNLKDKFEKGPGLRRCDWGRSGGEGNWAMSDVVRCWFDVDGAN